MAGAVFVQGQGAVGAGPRAGLAAWCGDPQAPTRSVVDISDFAGQTVQFRFRFASDSSANRPNGAWFLDDVQVQNCEVDMTEIFSDGFETAGTNRWSASAP